jgi:hypothetical protein
MSHIRFSPENWILSIYIYFWLKGKIIFKVLDILFNILTL